MPARLAHLIHGGCESADVREDKMVRAEALSWLSDRLYFGPSQNQVS
jgi:hypothetical protein